MTEAPTMTGVIPYLNLDANAAAAFYAKAFGAVEVMRMPSQDGKRLMHCHMTVNGGNLLFSDAFPEHGYPLQAPQGYTLHLQVDDVDAWWDRAVKAGCEIAMPLAEQFWGDRYGQLKDPFGVMWSMGQSKA